MMRNNAASRCLFQFVIDSKVSVKYVKNDPLTQDRTSDDPIQLRPQHIIMSNVRIGNSNVEMEQENFLRSKFCRTNLYYSG